MGRKEFQRLLQEIPRCHRQTMPDDNAKMSVNGDTVWLIIVTCLRCHKSTQVGIEGGIEKAVKVPAKLAGDEKATLQQSRQLGTILVLGAPQVR